MCNVPSLGDLIGAGEEYFGTITGFKAGAEAVGLPTAPELTGAEAAKEMQRQQLAQEEEFNRQQLEAEENRRRAAETTARGGTTARGRASTLLTGSGGLLDTNTGARRTLMGA